MFQNHKLNHLLMDMYKHLEALQHLEVEVQLLRQVEQVLEVMVQVLLKRVNHNITSVQMVCFQILEQVDATISAQVDNSQILDLVDAIHRHNRSQKLLILNAQMDSSQILDQVDAHKLNQQRQLRALHFLQVI